MFCSEDLSALAPDELEQELAAQAAHVEAGLCRLLELVEECRRRLPLVLDGTTFAGWLAYRCSLSPRQAREYERVAERLEDRPLTHAAFARGELSFSKVAALTRIDGPVDEAELVELAGALTASQLERAVGAYRTVAREDAARMQDREFLRYRWAGDGSLALRARLTADDGATVLRALDAGRDAVLAERAGTPAEPILDDDGVPTRPFECRVTNAEALVAVAELALAAPGGDRAGGDRARIVVHVDAATLAAGTPGRCELEQGIPLAAETARRLACDSPIVALLERDGETLSLGRKRRTVSPALRRALTTRDRGCRFPGCESTRFTDAHHLRHWSSGGPTSLDNLISLCRRHHRLVHERGYSVELGANGEARFTNEYGVTIPNVPRSPPSHRDALRDRHRRRGLRIDHETCRNGFGDRMELALAVDAILSLAR